MRKLSLLTLFLGMSVLMCLADGFEGEGLTHLHQNTKWYRMMHQRDANVLKVIECYHDYFKNHKFERSIETREFEKWERFVVNEFDAKGNLLKKTANWKDVAAISSSKRKLKSTAGAWTPVGPDGWDLTAPMQSAHPTQGVFRSVTEHPTDPQKVWAGSISSGLWYSMDGAENWSCVTNHLLLKSVRGVAISPSDTQILYAATSQGVIKSVDGGVNWDFTQLDWRDEYPSGSEPMQMQVSSTNPDIAFWGGGRGTFRTIDGGETWTKVLTSKTWDIEFHPTNSNIIYATTLHNSTNTYWAKNCDFWRSDDAGQTWTLITEGFPVMDENEKMKRMVIAVTPAAPDNVYLFAGGSRGDVGGVYGIFKSIDAGISFGHICCGAEGVEAGTSSTPNLLDYETNGLGDGGGQYTWDMDLAVSTTDPNFMLAAGINLWKSNDGGASWSIIDRGHPKTSSKWFHYDIQSVHIYGDRVWITSDGGVSLSHDKCTTVATKNNGIIAHEIWGFDQAWKSNIMAVGLYHGPVKIRDDELYDGWMISSGADASNVMINKGDDRYIYAHPWGDVKITRSETKDVAPKIVDLGAKLLSYIHPLEFFNHRYYNTFYTLDQSDLKMTIDNANSWKIVKHFSSRPYRIATSFSAPNTAYVINNWNKVNRTDDGGKTWTNVTPPSSVTADKAFSNVTIDGQNPDIAWISMKGKQSDAKVLKTTDGGATWVDYSGSAGNLPSYPLNVIAHQIGTDGGVYIGGSGGVWYRNNSMTDWVHYSANLPKGIEVWFIRLNYALKKIRIGTLSGVWEAPFYETSTTIANPMVSAYKIPVGQATRFADHSVCLDDATFEWEFPGGEPATSTDEFPEVTYAEAGEYNVTLTVTDANGTSTKTVENMVKASNGMLPLDRTGWEVIYADSEETVGEQAGKEKILDGNPSTIWHTKWYGGNDAYPHEIHIDMKVSHNIDEITVLPRQGSANGRIAQYEVYVSEDNSSWGEAVASGTWENTGAEKSVKFAATDARYIRIKALSEVNNQAFASIAEVNVWEYCEDDNNNEEESYILERDAWQVIYADSEEKTGENGSKENIIDNDSGTIWHTKWYGGSDEYPHEIQIDMNAVYELDCFSVLPRQSGSNGVIKDYELYVSETTDDWGEVVLSGSFENSKEEQICSFTPKAGRYIKLKALSEMNEQAFASIAELYVWGKPYDNVKTAALIQENGKVLVYSHQNKAVVQNHTSKQMEVTVYNQQGRLISNDRYSPKDSEIHFTGLNLGVYIFKIKIGNEVVIEKIAIR